MPFSLWEHWSIGIPWQRADKNEKNLPTLVWHFYRDLFHTGQRKSGKCRKIGNVSDDVFIYVNFSSIIKDKRKSDGKTDEDLCDTDELILPENAILWKCTDSKTIKNKVYRGGRCELQCKEFYKPVVGKSCIFKVKLSLGKFPRIL